MAVVARLFAVTIDCPEPVELAGFYQTFAGGDVVLSANEDFAALTTGTVRLDFQRVTNPAAPWPDGEAPRRVHLDFAVDDLDAAEAHMREQGAVLADHQPGGRRFRVWFDPAGHPFCLVDAVTQDL
ncbi:VOC family protein [Actinomadura sp. DC4]|uniref:VOC family protein n=1 Tax=Actinomadura sp. DC4 TaxID=3055069 RepID=UPI0025B21E44|nr:VOC family protein [Actinomadura sp. DC4]MDN3360058.1 VOC family protein [Actinomadura sp. DC4]